MKSLKITLLGCALCFGGCATEQNASLGPMGARRDLIYKDHIKPTNVPIIKLARDNVPDFWTATPSVIDTNAFATRLQLRGEVPGFHPRPAQFLPPHKKPHLDEIGPPNALRAGGGQTNTVVHNEVGFTAIVQTGWNPPDPSLAVGPEHIVVTVNMAIAFFDKAGNEEFSANLDSSGNPGFFEEIGGGSFTFDPKCFYDSHAERFVVLALEHYDGESWITMAVSDDSNPNGIWFKYRLWSVITNEENGNTYWVDYPGFGFDGSHYYITGNLFGLNNNNFGGVLYRVLSKVPMLQGSPVLVADVRKAGHVSMQGAQHHGDAPSAFFVGRRNSTELRISHINNTMNPSVVSEFVAVPNHGTPSGGITNPGGSISALDGRIMNAQYRDGSLWTAHGIDGTGVDGVGRWYEIDLSDWPTAPPSLVQSGDTTVEGLSTFFPAIAPNKRGEVVVVVASASSTTNPTLHLVGRKQNDPLGTMGIPVQVAESDTGADGRWGDYFDVAIDPTNDIRFWYIGEYQAKSGWHTFVGSAILTCIEDINADGNVNVTDLLLLIANWGTSGSSAEIAAPYDSVDVSDLLALVSAFGNCPK